MRESGTIASRMGMEKITTLLGDTMKEPLLPGSPMALDVSLTPTDNTTRERSSSDEAMEKECTWEEMLCLGVTLRTTCCTVKEKKREATTFSRENTNMVLKNTEY